MSEQHTVRQGIQIIVDGLRIGVVGAGLAEGRPAARLALRDAESVQDVLLFVGDRAETSRKSVLLLGATEVDDVPGTGVAHLEISDLPD